MKLGNCVGAIQPYSEEMTSQVRNSSTSADIAQYSVVLFDTTTLATKEVLGSSPLDFSDPYIPVTVAATANSPLKYGVAKKAAIVANKPGEVVIKGFTPVLKKAEAWTVGDIIVTDSGTAGYAAVNNSATIGTMLGVCVVTQALTTDTYGYIWIP